MDGLPVVLVHGGGHGAWCWAPLVDALTVGDFADSVHAHFDGRVEVLDLDTGHNAVPSRPCELATIVDRIAAVAV